MIGPFATPPIAGLQLIWAMVCMFMVARSTLAPRLAAPTAASQPAWPAPTTMTLYFGNIILPDALQLNGIFGEKVGKDNGKSGFPGGKEPAFTVRHFAQINARYQAYVILSEAKDPGKLLVSVLNPFGATPRILRFAQDDKRLVLE